MLPSQNYFGNVRQPPRWMGDFAGRDQLYPYPAKLDKALFTDQGGIPVTVAASAIATATSVTIAALTLNAFASQTLISAGNIVIPAGTTIYFGTNKYATLTANAKLGDTTLTVAALPTALAGTETGTYNWWNGKTIPSGMLVSRTLAQRDANALWHPAISTEAEIALIAFDIPNAIVDDDIALYRPNAGLIVKENYLPGYNVTAGFWFSDAGVTPTANLTKLRAIYNCIKGTD